MKILITGGAGFLGSNLCERLLGEGHEVWVADNLLTGDIENIDRFKNNPNFRFLVCSIESQEFLNFCEEAGNNFDRVYHLACATGVPNISTLGEEMLTACSTGTVNVLKVAEKSKARLIFTSSSEVYGEPQKTPQDESYTGNVETVGPRANYEEGKRFSETLVAHFANTHGIYAVIVRLFNAYGPNMSPRDTRVIPNFARQIIAGSPLTIQGDGIHMRTFCFFTDILDGFEAVLSNGTSGEIYNLGSDIPTTINELAETMIKLSDSPSNVEHVFRPSHDHSSRMPNLNKIRSLGWNNNVSLENGIKATIDYFKKRLESKPAYSTNNVLQAK
jgi:nucleoside-diphosphate-sugar epimerase